MKLAPIAPVAAIALIAACGAKRSAEPIPPATPIESNIQICVIDPIAPGGLMSIGAIHVPDRNDTVVVQSEGRVSIAKAVAGPQVLADAKWITPRSPLQLTTSAGRVTFTASGQPRAFEPGKVTLLGLVRGLPLYASPPEGGPMRAEVEALAARGVDLEKALQQRPGLRRQMARVKTLYVPTSIVGCMFQPLAARRR